jgi:uncharacterized membrane protein YhhN
MSYLFIALYILCSAVHLYHSWKDIPKKRAMTKPWLLLLLTGWYVVSTRDLSWVLVAALLTSWLGDVLLIPKGHGWFTAGGISFLLSHFLFIAVYAPSVTFGSIPWLLVVPVALVYFGISIMIIRAVKPTTPKAMVAPMCLYLIANSTMNIFALMRCLTLRTPGGLVAVLGAVLFFVSDCTLFLVRYYPKKQLIFKKHFTVMLTYLAGEALITLGILMN